MRKGGVPWGGGRQIGYGWLWKGGRGGERQISGYVIYERPLTLNEKKKGSNYYFAKPFGVESFPEFWRMHY